MPGRLHADLVLCWARECALAGIGVEPIVCTSRKNGRKLTALCYLNMEWSKGDGGELRVYKPDRKTVVTYVFACPGVVVIASHGLTALACCLCAVPGWCGGVV